MTQDVGLRGAVGQDAIAPGTAPDVVAAVSHLTHRYGQRLALDDVSVCIPAGCMVGLIGPDGVGKSTLQALIAGVRRIQSGEVRVFGRDIAKGWVRQAVASRIAYVPQGLGRSLYPTLSVRENIDFFGRLFGESAQERRWRIDELLRGTGLHPFADRAAGKLSGGMKQKLALCCSLVHEPDFLILDEPTTGVDPLSRQRFWALIERMRARRPHLSVLTATAYMEEAEGFEHLIAMEAGRVVAEGTPHELKTMTGCDTLEAAFITLLPKDQRSEYRPPKLPPSRFHDDLPAIEAEGLTMRFGNFTAVDDVSMRVERGEIFGFLGSNGCGKTTTMKMLTGLLQPTAGIAKLFGQQMKSGDLNLRKRVGYMSQSFSLYSELTVRQNLVLHAHLFHLPAKAVKARVAEMLRRFDLGEVADEKPGALPLGVRQRLQLAVAVIHEPEILILDEPTSGVDPINRDRFWELLISLSREGGVTIFISTHFVTEAERCDRVSLMHAGRILAMGTPDALRRKRGAHTLEEAFIGYLEDAAGPEETAEMAVPAFVGREPAGKIKSQPWLNLGRLWAFARRESMELMRDPIRISFALIGPLVLTIAMAYGISFDLEHVHFGVLDQDRSQESRALVEDFSGSRYFRQTAVLHSQAEIDKGFRHDRYKVALVIPPHYGRDLLAGRRPEVGVWLDGSNTIRAETARGYVQGVLSDYVEELAAAQPVDASSTPTADIETRFRYNQAFLSIYAISPGVLMMILIMFSSMLTALGVVREKELGSITNFYAAPARKLEFLVGKQLPYVALACLSFVELVVLIRFGLGVPMAGSFAALAVGAVLYGAAATAFGLVVSCFVASQIAAIFGSSIIVMIPTVNFSGMMYPVSTLEGGARLVGMGFPALYFQRISSGVFNKGLGFVMLWPNQVALGVFCLVFIAIAALLLKRQEK